MFPGQGTQHQGMGKELHENFAVARETFEEASDAVKFDIAKLCFDGVESELALTENTQPCLLTVSIAALRVAQAETGFVPAVTAGHSLGEYAALVAAGAIPFASAVRWVRERGLAMQSAVPLGQGAMAAIIGLDDDTVSALCREATAAGAAKRCSAGSDFTVEAVVEPANYNAPSQVVVSGSADAVAEAIALIKSGDAFKGASAVSLPVSAPFHSRLMKPARDRMAELFAAASPGEIPVRLSCPYVPNRTARLTNEPGVVLEFLVEQVDRPVLWKQSVLALVQAGFTKAVEFGPGSVLQGLAKRITRRAPGGPLATTGVSDLQSLKNLAGGAFK